MKTDAFYRSASGASWIGVVSAGAFHPNAAAVFRTPAASYAPGHAYRIGPLRDCVAEGGCSFDVLEDLGPMPLAFGSVDGNGDGIMNENTGATAIERRAVALTPALAHRIVRAGYSSVRGLEDVVEGASYAAVVSDDLGAHTLVRVAPATARGLLRAGRAVARVGAVRRDLPQGGSRGPRRDPHRIPPPPMGAGVEGVGAIHALASPAVAGAASGLVSGLVGALLAPFIAKRMEHKAPAPAPAAKVSGVDGAADRLLDQIAGNPRLVDGKLPGVWPSGQVQDAEGASIGLEPIDGIFGEGDGVFGVDDLGDAHAPDYPAQRTAAIEAMIRPIQDLNVSKKAMEILPAAITKIEASGILVAPSAASVPTGATDATDDLARTPEGKSLLAFAKAAGVAFYKAPGALALPPGPAPLALPPGPAPQAKDCACPKCEALTKDGRGAEPCPKGCTVAGLDLVAGEEDELGAPWAHPVAGPVPRLGQQRYKPGSAPAVAACRRDLAQQRARVNSLGSRARQSAAAIKACRTQAAGLQKRIALLQSSLSKTKTMLAASQQATRDARAQAAQARQDASQQTQADPTMPVDDLPLDDDPGIDLPDDDGGDGDDAMMGVSEIAEDVGAIAALFDDVGWTASFLGYDFSVVKRSLADAAIQRDAAKAVAELEKLKGALDKVRADTANLKGADVMQFEEDPGLGYAPPPPPKSRYCTFNHVTRRWVCNPAQYARYKRAYARWQRLNQNWLTRQRLRNQMIEAQQAGSEAARLRAMREEMLALQQQAQPFYPTEDEGDFYDEDDDYDGLFGADDVEGEESLDGVGLGEDGLGEVEDDLGAKRRRRRRRRLTAQERLARLRALQARHAAAVAAGRASAEQRAMHSALPVVIAALEKTIHVVEKENRDLERVVEPGPGKSAYDGVSGKESASKAGGSQAHGVGSAPPDGVGFWGHHGYAHGSYRPAPAFAVMPFGNFAAPYGAASFGGSPFGGMPFGNLAAPDPSYFAAEGLMGAPPAGGPACRPCAGGPMPLPAPGASSGDVGFAPMGGDYYPAPGGDGVN